MNALAQALPHQFVTEDVSVEAALAQVGWQPQGPATWRFATKRGDAILQEIAHRNIWRQFQLFGGATPLATNNRVLQHNHRLRGPAKFVTRTGDSAVCRFDIPDDLASSTSDYFAFGADRGLNVCNSWVQAVTEIATGEFRPANSVDHVETDSVERLPLTSDGESVTDSAIAAEIKQAGWSVTIDNGQTTIHLQLPGVYRSLMLERDKRGGICLAANLIELAGLGDECLRAISLLAVDASSRLPLVRMAVFKPSKSKSAALHAEVSFGAALTTGSLLLHALHVFEIAVGLTAREFHSLRDPALARRVIEATAVRNPQGQF